LPTVQHRNLLNYLLPLQWLMVFTRSSIFPKQKEKGMKNMSLNPAPIKVETLRQHFRTVYKLNEEQINLMIASSSRSLRSAFQSFDEISDDEDIYKKIMMISHSIKGLLLNMGQPEWAECAKEIEDAAKMGEDRDYKEMVQRLRLGMQELYSMTQP
jgi:HPt (histidine-containing phosphotransfer) domain-containing protein